MEWKECAVDVVERDSEIFGNFDCAITKLIKGSGSKACLRLNLQRT